MTTVAGGLVEVKRVPIMANFDLPIQEAVRRDDADKIKSLLLEYVESLENNGGITWLKNLFLIAYEEGSFHITEELAKQWPKIASIQCDDGSTAMHLVSQRGDVKMVNLFGKLDPDSCLARDKFSKLPVHVAAEKGDSAVIQALVRLRPDSLENVTSNQETVLHLVAKNSKFDAFQVLMDEIKRANQKDLLNSKDNEGNTVLHIATVSKSIQIVQLLFRECSNSDMMSLFGSRNNMGQTALDLCPSNAEDEADKEIKKILEDAAASHQELGSSREQSSAKLTSETRNLLLIVLGVIAAAAFTVTCNLPASFLKDHAGETVSAEDMISGRLPTVFYLMVFNSAGFMTTMATMVILIWPLLFRTILLFVMICTCIVYTILVGKITPEFYVRVGTSSISGIEAMWSLAITFVFCGVAVLCMGRYIWYCFRRFIRLWPRRTGYWSNNSGRNESMVELVLVK